MKSLDGKNRLGGNQETLFDGNCGGGGGQLWRLNLQKPCECTDIGSRNKEGVESNPLYFTG